MMSCSFAFRLIGGNCTDWVRHSGARARGRSERDVALHDGGWLSYAVGELGVVFHHVGYTK